MRLLAEAKELFDAGGAVMVPLVGVGLILWYLLTLRFFRLHRSFAKVPCSAEHSEEQIEQQLSKMLLGSGVRRLRSLEIDLTTWRNGLQRHRAMITTLVASAPLLGLLGTVSGMIVTFEGMTEMALFTQTGGIAGGISEALSTTQMGLAIALPGLLVEQLLNRRQRRLNQQIERLSVICRRLRHQVEAGA